MARKQRSLSINTNERLNAYVMQCISQYYADLCKAQHHGDIKKLLTAVETNSIQWTAEYKGASRSYKVIIQYGKEPTMTRLVFNVSKYKLDKLEKVDGEIDG